MPPRTGLLLIAHGSRQEDANADLFHIVAAMRLRAEQEVVEAAFLELAEPGMEQGAARCIAQGARRVVLLPYFLSSGVHVRRDLTALCTRLAEQYPAVQFHLAEPLGQHPLMLEVVAERAQQAVQAMDR